MLRNFFLTAVRNLFRHKTFTALNIGGLVLGIGCAIVLFSFIKFETSYNKFNQHYQDIYRIVLQHENEGNISLTAQVPHPLGKTLRNELSTHKKIAQLFYHGEAQITISDQENKLDHHLENGIAFSDGNFFEILDFKWLAGEGSISQKDVVVLSQTAAEKYFGATRDFRSLLGEVIVMDNTRNLKIVGIYEDHPDQSDFRFSMVVDYESQDGINEYFGKGELWERLNGRTNVLMLLPSSTDLIEAEQQINLIYEKHSKMEGSQLKIQPLSDLHYNTNLGVINGRVFPIQASWTLSIIAFLLLVACSINFINLSTAKATNRAKEVGIRKVLGSKRNQLIFQHLSETLLIVGISMIGALATAELLFKWIEPIIGQALSLSILPKIWLVVMVGCMVVGITALTGIYPALIISSFRPVHALKATMGSVKNRGSLSMRRMLVMLQFVISQALLIGTIVVMMQNNFLRNQELGFEKEGVISIELPEINHQKTQVLKNELMNIRGVSSVSAHLGSPIARTNNTGTVQYTTEEGKIFEFSTSFKDVDEDYIGLFGIMLLAGNNVDKNSGPNVMVNLKTIQEMGFDRPEDAIGKHLTTRWGGDYIIAGVVDDFHSRSFHKPLQNVIMSYRDGYFYELAIKIESISAESMDHALSELDKIWLKVYPEYVLNYDFLDESIQSIYEVENRTAKLFRLFAVIAIIIGCLGLYGLIDFVAIKRMKEIGIRKVLGASVMNILKLFMKELVLMIMISVFIAGPIMYFFMTKWLDSYPYRIPLGYEAFVISFLLISIVTLLTMGYRSVKASYLNPVATLKDE